MAATNKSRLEEVVKLDKGCGGKIEEFNHLIASRNELFFIN